MIFRSWVFRLLLLLVLIGAVVSIVLNFVARSGPGNDGPPAPLLAPEIARRSTDFDYAQLKEDRVVFRVVARTSTALRDGEHLLEEVRLTRFNAESEPADTVEARGAVYRIARREIEFSENVRIRLEDGTEIEADWAGADLEEELVSIRESFRLSQGEVWGEGRGLEYRIPQRTIRVKDGLRLQFSAGEGRAHSTSREAVYRLADGNVRLTGDALIRLGESELAAPAIDLTFSADRRIEGVTASGAAKLAVSEAQSFSGETIRIHLSGLPEAGRLEVRGQRSPTSRGPGTAVFRETTDAGLHELRAAYIHGLFAGAEGEAAAADRVRLRSIRAQRDVSLRSAPAGIDDGRADYFRGDMALEDDRFDSLLLSGNVLLKREVESQTETLEAARVRLWLEPDSAPRALEASGSARIEVDGEGAARRLEAGDRLRVDYRNGRIREAVATGGCSLEREDEAERSRLDAATVRLAFDEGLIRRAEASGDVRVAAGLESGDYTSRSDRVTLEYEEGLLVRSIHEGAFRVARLEGEGREARLWGDRGIFEAASRTLSVDGPTRARLRLEGPEEDFLTTADSVAMDLRSEEISALGSVESVMEGGEARIVLTAGRMLLDLEEGWVAYSDRPRMVQGANLIAGRDIRINRETRHLIVDEDVDSFLVEETAGDSRSYHVQARRLTLTDQGRKAVYEGDVAFEGAELRLDAPRLEAFFENGPEQALERVEATGGVVILERGRRWRAQTATYLREADRIVVAR